MFAMFPLLFSYFRKSFHTIFFAFVFPIIMLTLLVAVTGGQGVKNAASSCIPGLATASASVIGIVTLSMTYSDFKQSIIIKRIGATPIKSWQFILSLIIFHVLLIFISNFWVMGIGIAIYHSQIELKLINWGYVLLAILLASLISCSVGVIIGVVAKDFKMANAFSLLLYLPTSFISGQYLPYATIANNNTLVAIAKIMPFSYPVSIMNRGWIHFSSKIPDNYSLFPNYWIPIVVSIARTVVLLTVAILAYKFRRKN